MTELRPHLREETACVICGERDYEVVGTRDRDGRPLRTTICRRCGMVWTNPRPSRHDVEQYYRHHYRTDYQQNRHPNARKVLRGMLGAFDRRRLILPMLKPGARVLDVGSGAGELIYVLRASGVDAVGIEPDDAFGDFAREVLKVPVHTGVVTSDVFPPASFDVITMFHALEHTAEPVETLSLVAAWLAAMGSLVVEVPNVDARCQAPGHRFHYAHLFSFSADTLNAAAAKAGLIPIRTQLSDDEGNIIALLRKGAPSPALPVSAASYDRTRDMLRSHTALGHYTSATPYVRALIRLRRRRREDRLLRRLRTMDGILQWAAQAGSTARTD